MLYSHGELWRLPNDNPLNDIVVRFYIGAGEPLNPRVLLVDHDGPVHDPVWTGCEGRRETVREGEGDRGGGKEEERGGTHTGEGSGPRTRISCPRRLWCPVCQRGPRRRTAGEHPAHTPSRSSHAERGRGGRDGNEHRSKVSEYWLVVSGCG